MASQYLKKRYALVAFAVEVAFAVAVAVVVVFAEVVVVY